MLFLASSMSFLISGVMWKSNFRGMGKGTMGDRTISGFLLLTQRENKTYTESVFTPEKEIWMSGWDGNWAAESNWNKYSAFKHVQSRCGEHSHARGSKGFLYENKLKIICDLLTCTLQRGRSGLRWGDLQPERARSLLHTPHPLQQWTGREKKKQLRKTLHVFSIAEGFNGLIILLLQ